MVRVIVIEAFDNLNFLVNQPIIRVIGILCREQQQQHQYLNSETER